MKTQTDITIIGNGPVARIAAAYLSKMFNVTVVTNSVERHEQRIMALSSVSVALLEQLNIWSAVSAKQAIDNIQFTYGGHTTVLAHTELFVPHFGYTVNYSDLCQAAFYESNITLVTQSTNNIDKFLNAGIVIVADGGGIDLSKYVEYKIHRYQQLLLTTHIMCDRVHTTAYEYFGDNYAYVLLPYVNNIYMCILIVDSVGYSAVGLKHKNQVELQEYVLSYMGSSMREVGNMTIMQDIMVSDMVSKVAKNTIYDHLILLGNAAQSMHPVLAQGLNLAIRQVAALPDTIKNILNKRLDKSHDIDRKMTDKLVNLVAHNITQNTSFARVYKDIAMRLFSNCSYIRHNICNRLLFGAQ
jgi:2-octaprenyl-6-methoxyphenol hydroxylase